MNQERDLAVPAKENAQVVVDAECPVLAEFALELVCSKERVARILCEASQRRRNAESSARSAS